MAVEHRNNCFISLSHICDSYNKWTNFTGITALVSHQYINWTDESLWLYNQRRHLSNERPNIAAWQGLRSSICSTQSQWSKDDVNTNMAFWKPKPLLTPSGDLRLSHLLLVNKFKDSFIKDLQTHSRVVSSSTILLHDPKVNSPNYYALNLLSLFFFLFSFSVSTHLKHSFTSRTKKQKPFISTNIPTHTRPGIISSKLGTHTYNTQYTDRSAHIYQHPSRKMFGPWKSCWISLNPLGVRRKLCPYL